MVERVRATVEHVIDAQAAAAVANAVRRAVGLRHALDPEGPVYLHPARTVLILVADCMLYDVDALVAGALLETHHVELAADPAHATTPRAAALLAAVPRPAELDEDELRERLISAEPVVRLVALAERLDHARHLRQYPEAEWLPMYRGVRAVYLPVAEWADRLLGARYRRWASAFGRRIEEP
jgi:hypothetical protein